MKYKGNKQKGPPSSTADAAVKVSPFFMSTLLLTVILYSILRLLCRIPQGILGESQ